MIISKDKIIYRYQIIVESDKKFIIVNKNFNSKYKDVYSPTLT